MIAESRSMPLARRAAAGADFRRGLVAPLVLWPGVIPFALAYALVARAAGFSPWETLLSSLLIFAGSAQLVAVNLVAGGAGIVAIVVTTLILNLRHILYGLSIDRTLAREERRARPLLAFLLTDELYGLWTRERLEGRGSLAYALGIGINLYLVWNLSTAAGALFGTLLPDPERIGLDFIFPLSFLALLLPLLRSRVALVVAATAGALVVLAAPFFSSGVSFLIAAIGAAAAGALLETRKEARA